MLKEEYPNLSEVIQNFFNVEIGWNREEGIDEFKTAVNYGGYDISEIKSELESMLSNSDFDWRTYSIETLLCYDRLEITNSYAKEYLKYCICDVLYPDKQIHGEEREKLNSIAIKCLDEYTENNGWCTLNDLYKLLIQHSEFSDLEYHNIFHLINDSIGRIEMKYESFEDVYQLLMRVRY